MSCTCDSHASIARGPRGTCVRVCFALRTTTDYIIIFIRPFNSVSLVACIRMHAGGVQCNGAKGTALAHAPPRQSMPHLISCLGFFSIALRLLAAFALLHLRRLSFLGEIPVDPFGQVLAGWSCASSCPSSSSRMSIALHGCLLSGTTNYAMVGPSRPQCQHVQFNQLPGC